MRIDRFTHTDYYDAALLRIEDLKHLRTNQKTVIFSLYCAGVAVECMLRAYIIGEFDAKHDLEKLYEKSQLATLLEIKEKQKLSIAIKKINKIWDNNLRYTSEKRIKRLIGHEIVRSGCKDINKYLDKYYSDIFDAADFIIKIGENKWTS